MGLIFLAGCTQPVDVPDDSESPTPRPTGVFSISSSAFGDGQAIPRRHSCDAENVSPPIAFGPAPPNASHVALIMEDPDAPFGTVLHWTFWNLPANVTELAENATMVSHGAREGRDYRGPCPPIGTHRYFFYAYATRGALDLAEGSDVAALRAALQGRIDSEARMHGTYTGPNLPPLG